MEDITLLICDKTFKVKKQILCQYSDYFRAMFSGNYLEDQQKQISIHILDPNTMSIILKYMNIGLIDLSRYSLGKICEIAEAANFLQVTELIKQIKYTLGKKLCDSNWIEIMDMAKSLCYSELEQLSAGFGLYSFKSMKPKYIPTIHKLAWYLSHPYLDAQSELDVFDFGIKWIFDHQAGTDALLIVLGCLAFNKITNKEMEAIKKCTNECENSLAFKVTECLYELKNNNLDICEAALNDKKSELCEKFTERVWVETVNLTKESKSRLLKYTPMVPMWGMNSSKEDIVPHYMYTYTNKILEQWLEVADKDTFGWSAVSWGLTKLVVVCGEDYKTCSFVKDVKVYDTLMQEWTKHGVDLPPRKYAGVAVVGNLLYIIGGTNKYRKYAEGGIIYDLKKKTYRHIAKFPEETENPAICSHKNKVYVGGIEGIFCYKGSGTSGHWKYILDTKVKMNCIRSYKDHIYCSRVFSRSMFRFNPDTDDQMEFVTFTSSYAYSMCSIGNGLILFTNLLFPCLRAFTVTVEEYIDGKKHAVFLLRMKNETMQVTVSGACALATTLPPLCMELSKYHHKYLFGYAHPKHL